jgi:hypothetical protein
MITSRTRAVHGETRDSRKHTSINGFPEPWRCAPSAARFLNLGSPMVERADGWMVAAACSEGPRAQRPFVRLPRAYRQEMLHFALVAAASSAFFVALAMLLRPLPSRSLAAHGRLPASSSTRAAALEARLALATDAPPPPRLRRRPAPQRSEVAVAAMAADPIPAASPVRRRNVFSRFFRGMLARTAPTVKADPVE